MGAFEYGLVKRDDPEDIFMNFLKVHNGGDAGACLCTSRAIIVKKATDVEDLLESGIFPLSERVSVTPFL